MNRLFELRKMAVSAMQRAGSNLSSFFCYKVKNRLALNKGLGSIELIVLIMVLVGLALLFKDKITAFLGELTSQMNASEIMNKTKN